MTSPALTAQRYSTVAIILHWSIALFILLNIATGFVMEGTNPPLKFLLIRFHMSAGITVLVLSVARVAWRLTHRPPPFTPHMARWERGLAHAAHALLYLLMIGMPLIGWALVSANVPGRLPPFRVWGIVPWPMIEPLTAIGAVPSGVARQDVLHDQFVALHALGGYVLLALIVLHVAGALKHQFIDREREFARMWPRRKPLERQANQAEVPPRLIDSPDGGSCDRTNPQPSSPRSGTTRSDPPGA